MRKTAKVFLAQQRLLLAVGKVLKVSTEKFSACAKLHKASGTALAVFDRVDRINLRFQ